MKILEMELHMLQVILAIVSIVILFYLIKYSLKVIMGVLGIAAIIAAIALGGAQVASGFLIATITSKTSKGIFLLVILSIISCFSLYKINNSLDIFLLIAFAATAITAIFIYKRKILTEKYKKLKIFQENDLISEGVAYTSLALALTAGLSDQIFHYISINAGYAKYAYWTYLILSYLASLAIIAIEGSAIEVINKFSKEDLSKLVNVNELLNKYKEEISAFDSKSEEIILNIISYCTASGGITIINLNGEDYISTTESLYENLEKLKTYTTIDQRSPMTMVTKTAANVFSISEVAAKDYIEKYLEYGSWLNFSDGKYFVPHEFTDSVNICKSCGLAEISVHAPNWFCSDVCEETEEICLEIKNKPYSEFIETALSSGVILMSGSESYGVNHKVFATGGQGHGFSAENANHMIDKLRMKEAEILGNNNAKNGPDRLVNGVEIQTKYLGTAARSVGAAFDGQNGQYRYYDKSGSPMQLEVPKDQYLRSIEVMKSKIREGKVPGVTDPEHASKLIRKGGVTYDQAVNITKFGTFESLTYDFMEGSVIGLTAAGITFSIHSTIYFVKSGDIRESLRTAAFSGGRAFATALSVHMVGQQLHRLSGVQTLLSRIDARNLSSGSINFLKKGFGVDSTNALTRSIQGLALTSFALIVVTTGPDMINFARGKISKEFLLEKVVVATGGVAGSAAGTVVGRWAVTSILACTPLAPFSGLIGATAGGLIGGLIGASVAGQLIGGLTNAIREESLKLIRDQLSYLVMVFIITDIELDIITKNLQPHLNDETISIIHNASNKRAMSNLFIKPIVVSVVKQRPALVYSTENIIDSVEDLAA